MGDLHRLFYAFAEPWDEDRVRDLVAFLDREYAVEAPGAEDGADLDHCVERLTAGKSVTVPVTTGIEPSLRYDVDADRDPVVWDCPNLALQVSDSRFLSPLPDEPDGQVEAFYEFLVGLYEQFVSAGRTVRYVYGLTGEDEYRIATPQFDVALDRERLAAGELPGVVWCQVVPPELVDTVGEERLLSAPVHRAERLADGAVFLVLHDFPGAEGIVEVPPVAEHLGVPYSLPYPPE